MNKQFTVTFELDAATETVSNLTVFVDGIEKKKTTTQKAKPKDVELEDTAIITLEENKLVFNNRAVSDMGLEWKDRVIIKYDKFEEGVGKKLMPLIGKDVDFDQEGSGNQVTKTNTVAYRGKANTILAEYGNEFTIEKHEDGIWKLISNSGGNENLTYKETVEKAEEIDITILTDEGHGEDTAIDEMTFKLIM